MRPVAWVWLGWLKAKVDWYGNKSNQLHYPILDVFEQGASAIPQLAKYYFSASDIDVDAGRETRGMTKGRLLLPTSTSMPLLHSDPPGEPNDCNRDKVANETTSLIELLIEVDHDMAIFEFALVSSISRRLRTEAEADSVQVCFSIKVALSPKYTLNKF